MGVGGSFVVLVLGALVCVTWTAWLATRLLAGESARPGTIQRALVWSVVVAAVVNEGFSPRADPTGAVSPTPAFLEALATLPLTTMVNGLLLALCVLAVGSRPPWRIEGPARLLALATAGLLVAIVLSAVGGTRGGITWQDLTLPVALIAAVSARSAPLSVLSRDLHVALLTVVALSLAAGVLLPEWATLGDLRREVLPLVEDRLTGLTWHPNRLALAAATLVVLSVFRLPNRAAAVGLALGVVALLWTDSLTGFAGGAAGVAVLTVFRASPGKGVLRVLAATSVVLLLGLGGWMSLTPQGRATVADLGEGSASLANLGARTLAWEAAFDEFAERPLLGYGPRLFDEAHRAEVFGPAGRWIGHAHNQFAQSLAAGGIIGLLAAVAFLVVCVRVGVIGMHDGRGLGLALVALVVTNAVAEPSLQTTVPSTNLLVLVAMVTVLIASVSAPSPHAAPVPPRDSIGSARGPGRLT